MFRVSDSVNDEAVVSFDGGELEPVLLGSRLNVEAGQDVDAFDLP